MDAPARIWRTPRPTAPQPWHHVLGKTPDDHQQTIINTSEQYDEPEVKTRHGLGLLTKAAVAILSVSTFTVTSAMAAAPGLQLAQVAPLQQQLLSPAQQQLRLQQPLQLQQQQLQGQQMLQQQQLQLQEHPAQPLFQPQVQLKP